MKQSKQSKGKLNINSPPRARMASPTGLLLLQIFHEKNLDSPSAYREACDRTGKDYLVGTIKSAISRLRKKGLIDETDIKTDGRLRRVYGITDEGLSMLEEYRQLMTPVGGPNPNCTVLA